MDITTIITKLSPYALPALAAALIAAGAIYFAVTMRKKSGRHNGVSKARFAAIFLLAGWLTAVVGITLLSRGENTIRDGSTSGFSADISARGINGPSAKFS